MKAKTLLCSLVIASMGVGSVSFAQSRRDEEHGRGNDARHEQRDERNGRGNDARHEQRDERDDRGERSNNREEHRYYNAREFRRGSRLPSEYRNRQYVVSDWRSHHLSAPPRGYQWVQVGSDYVLAAVATGLIANLILNSH